jgi:hypothetical protein
MRGWCHGQRDGLSSSPYLHDNWRRRRRRRRRIGG